MPIYDYKCIHCNISCEKIVKFSDKDKMFKCEKYNKKSHKVGNVSGTTFKLKGSFHRSLQNINGGLNFMTRKYLSKICKINKFKDFGKLRRCAVIQILKKNQA